MNDSGQRRYSNMTTISGLVTDFDDNPLEGATVELKYFNFEAVFKTYSDAQGKYQIHAKKGDYLALAAYKDYKKRFLEYWAWHLPAGRDLNLNPRIGGIELYAMNGFIPQGAMPSLFVYFRPMSLKRYKMQKDSVDIGPELSSDDVKIVINGVPVELVGMNRLKETIDPNRNMKAYLVQSTLPEDWGKLDYLRVSVTIVDQETGEKGEGCIFIKNNFYD